MTQSTVNCRGAVPRAANPFAANWLRTSAPRSFWPGYEAGSKRDGMPLHVQRTWRGSGPLLVLGCNAHWLGLAHGVAMRRSRDIHRMTSLRMGLPAVGDVRVCARRIGIGAHMWRGGGERERGRTGTAEARGV